MRFNRFELPRRVCQLTGAAATPSVAVRLGRLVVCVGACAASMQAAALEVALPEYAVVITVPSVPAIALQTQPPSASRAAALRLAGADAGYRLDVALFDQGKATSARECAGVRLRAIVAQPGMPNRDSVYRAALTVSTFLVIYATERAGLRELHAHLIGVAGATHCAEAHVSRAARPSEDDDDWRLAFTNARIEALPR